ncbi:MAG TPA: hypothetical protein VEC38_15215 [Candidatus Binataceae bacterium]|nr:hypothetical protein [Candidatus Binataceae bacterium]
MANTYSLSTPSTVTTSSAPAAEFRAGSSNRAVILEVGIFLGAATASTYGVGRPAAIGVTPTSPVLGLAEDPADAAATAETAVAWGTAPTAPAHFFRHIALPATVGAGVIWTWSEGQELIVPAAGSIVLWNVATNSASVYWYIKWRE